MTLLYPYRSRVAPTVRSPWRQKLIDDAYRDIDACECHTDFILAILKHTKAWLAEANQWNAVPEDENLTVWNTFEITHPDIRLQFVRVGEASSTGSYWVNMHLSCKPGGVNAGEFFNVLPFSERREEPVHDAAPGAFITTYSHVAGSNSDQFVSAYPTATLAYVHKMVATDGTNSVASYRSTEVSRLEQNATLRIAMRKSTEPAGATWLAQHLEDARVAVQGAQTLRALREAVEHHMPTWFAASQGWDAGPPDVASAEQMASFTLPLTWRYDRYPPAHEFTVAGSGGQVLNVTLAADKHAMLNIALPVLRQIPLGLTVPCNSESLAYDRFDSYKSKLPLVVSCVASPLYSQLGRAVADYRDLLMSLGEGGHNVGARYEALALRSDRQCVVPLDGMSL